MPLLLEPEIPVQRRTASILNLCFVSGATALGYQTVWAKILGAGLGHELPAVLAVITSFMGGMAAGAWILHGRVAQSPRPLLWYVFLEIIIGVWGLLLSWGLPSLNQHAPSWIGLAPSTARHWLIAFAMPFFVLLPSTCAMGATFPALEKGLAQVRGSLPSVSAVYASNTFGGAAGALLTVFVVAPALGFHNTLLLMAAVNLGCALLAWALDRIDPAHVEQLSAKTEQPGFGQYRLQALLVLTGLLGIGYEVVGVRVLSQVLESSVYTFASILSVYLVGTAAGAAVYHRWGGRGDFRSILRRWLSALAITAALGVWAMRGAQRLHEALDASWLAAFPALREVAVALAVFALPTLCMGGVFSHLMEAAKTELGGVGRAVAFNTLGAALAGGLFGVLLFPWIGAAWTLVVLVAGYVALLPKPRGWQWCWPGLALVVAVTVPRPLRFIDLLPGQQVIRWKEGVMATVAVVEDPNRDRTLRVDNRFQMGGTAVASAEYRQAHFPLLLHPHPKRALFLGVGTGISMGGAVLHPNLQSDGVELITEVVDFLDAFEPANRSARQQTKIVVADARRYVSSCSHRYDVVIADLFHPARDGAGNLYALEHYRAIERILEPQGVFCHWLPLHQMNEEVLRSVVRTFLEVFPEAQAWLLRFNVDAPVVGLISRSVPFAADWIERRVGDESLRQELRSLALADSVRFFGCFVAGPHTLRSFAGNASLNTDDHPFVTFRAPERNEHPGAKPYDSLLHLVALPDDELTQLLPGDPLFLDRLTKYNQGRDIYLKGLVQETEGHVPEALAAYVESSRWSPDFTSGYARCVGLAANLARTQREEAKRLLQALMEARPENPVASQLYNRLFGE